MGLYLMVSCSNLTNCLFSKGTDEKLTARIFFIISKESNMPKVKIIRKDKIKLRSAEEKTGVDGDDQGLSQTPRSNSPSRTETKNTQPVIKNKFKERKYFKVKEDWAILDFYNENKDKLSSREISEQISTKIDHSGESIRDRIKRYMAKLSTFDTELMKQEQEVSLLSILYLMIESSINNCRKTLIFMLTSQLIRVRTERRLHTSPRRSQRLQAVL